MTLSPADRLRKAGLTAVAALVLSAGPALAQTKPAAPAPTKPAAAAPAAAQAPAADKPPSDDARKEARALGDRLGFTGQTQNLLAQIRNQLSIGFAQANQKPPQEMAKVVDEVLMPDFVGQSIEITNAIVDAWATAFTIDELKQLRTFYGSPLGDKLLKSQPAISQQWGAIAGPWTQKILIQAVQTHASELSARGIANNPFKPAGSTP